MIRGVAVGVVVLSILAGAMGLRNLAAGKQVTNLGTPVATSLPVPPTPW